MMHLDPRTYEGLLAGTLPAGEARALAEHLATDCEVCERFLAERTGTDALDGRSDAAIDRAFPPGPLPDDDLAFARVLRRLRAGGGARRRLLVTGAIAASLLAVAVAATLLRRSSPAGEAWNGVKGARVDGPVVRLRFARLGASGEAVAGKSGDRIDRGASLVFEVESARGGEVALARVTSDGTVEPLWQERVAPGKTVVGSGGRAAGYPLADRGSQRFVVVEGERLDPAQIEAAARAFAASGPGATSSGLSCDGVEVVVR